MLVDDHARLAFVSPAVVELAGRQVEVGEPLGGLLQVDAGGTGRPVQDLEELQHHEGSLAILHVDGRLVEVEVSARTVTDEGTVLNIRDVSERRRTQAEITHRAFFDPVTPLPNRALFFDRLDHALARAARERGLLAHLATQPVHRASVVGGAFLGVTGAASVTVAAGIGAGLLLVAGTIDASGLVSMGALAAAAFWMVAAAAAVGVTLRAGLGPPAGHRGGRRCLVRVRPRHRPAGGGDRAPGRMGPLGMLAAAPNPEVLGALGAYLDARVGQWGTAGVFTGILAAWIAGPLMVARTRHLAPRHLNVRRSLGRASGARVPRRSPLRGLHRSDLALHRGDDLEQGDVGRVASQQVATARTGDRVDDAHPDELGEDLGM